MARDLMTFPRTHAAEADEGEAVSSCKRRLHSADSRGERGSLQESQGGKREAEREGRPQEGGKEGGRRTGGEEERREEGFAGYLLKRASQWENELS